MKEDKSIMGHFGEIARKTDRLKGMMETKHFGAKHGARHKDAKAKALKKMRGESTAPF